jgi:hypothetical protein
MLGRSVLATARVPAHRRLSVRLVDPAAQVPAEMASHDIAATSLLATGAGQDWRVTQAGSIVRRLAPALIVFGAILTVLWAAVLFWATFCMFWY